MIASYLPKNEDEQIMSLFCTTTSKKPTQHLECPRLGSFVLQFQFSNMFLFRYTVTKQFVRLGVGPTFAYLIERI